MQFQLSPVQAGNRYFANLWDVNLAGAVDDYAKISFYLAPDFDLQLVPGPDDAITRTLRPIHRRKGTWTLPEKRLAKEWQCPADGFSDHLFELSFRPNR